jgi:hypothetical protein
MSWTPDPPPYATWTPEAATLLPWTPDPQSFAAWDAEGVDHQRITEAGRIRITEQAAGGIPPAAVIRIIERFHAKWSLSPPTTSPWTQE